MNIVNAGYSSTNYYVLEEGKSRLLVDVGMPGSYAQLAANLKRLDIPLPSIHYFLATHYHPDHAGIVEEVKAAGPRLLVMDTQLAAIPHMQQNYIKPNSGYVPIRLDNNIVLAVEQSRAFLESIGFQGEIVATPGHSDDSVSLVCDDGSAFVGDLTQPMMADEGNRELVLSSWEKLRRLGVKRVFPGHGPMLPIDSLIFE